MEETPTEQPGRIGTLPYFPMNAQESAKSRMAVATPRDTTIPEDHHNSIDHTPQAMDIRHSRIPRFPRPISSISPTPKAMKIRVLGVRSMELWWSSRIVVSVVWRLPFETLLSIHGEVWQGANTPGLLTAEKLHDAQWEGLAAHRVSLCTIQYLGNDTNLDA
ncbi:hypothetical protein E4U26_001619 [Claviceps purpurea]|nr:hypothetical protein E4U26_001619 [Claviceps purpurea]